MNAEVGGAPTKALGLGIVPRKENNPIFLQGEVNMYRCIATSVEGFVQQTIAYVSSGYLFYVAGTVPAEKVPEAIDRKLIERYGVAISKWARSRRKVAGEANVQYIRFERFFLLLATHGHHDFFLQEASVRDVRTHPIQFAGYSIGYRRGVDRKFHASCRIAPDEYAKLKAHFVEDLAIHRSVQNLIEAFGRIPWEPYAPVRRQLLNVLRAVNSQRDRTSYELVPISAIRFRRRIVRPFGVADEYGQVAA